MNAGGLGVYRDIGLVLIMALYGLSWLPSSTLSPYQSRPENLSFFLFLNTRVNSFEITILSID